MNGVGRVALLGLLCLPASAWALECPEEPSPLPPVIEETSAWCPQCATGALETLDVSLGAAKAVEASVDRELSTMLAFVRSEETGSATPDYGSITVDSGGLTYGAYQFDSESGAMRNLLTRYVAQHGKYATALTPYLEQMRRGESPHGPALQQLLHQASSDPVMQHAQESLYLSSYVEPALARAAELGIRSPAGAALYRDIYTNGGLDYVVRNARAEVPEIRTGADEERFLQAMLDARERYYRKLGAEGYDQYLHGWLARNGDYRDVIAKNGAGLKGAIHLAHAGTSFCGGSHADARTFELEMAGVAAKRRASVGAIEI